MTGEEFIWDMNWINSVEKAILTLYEEKHLLQLALGKLLDDSDPFLASPSENTRDSHPCSQPTTAGDCRTLAQTYNYCFDLLKDIEKNEASGTSL